MKRKTSEPDPKDSGEALPPQAARDDDADEAARRAEEDAARAENEGYPLGRPHEGHDHPAAGDLPPRVEPDEVALNPTGALELPAVRGGRDRVAPADEAAMLIEALREDDRALWATALYAGPRRGELRALCVEVVDLAAGVIRVERSWDDKAGPIEPKSAAGRRGVPIAGILRERLIAHRLRFGRSEGLMFGSDRERPPRPRPCPAGR